MNDKAIEVAGDNRPSWLNKQKSAMTYFHERLVAITPKWRREAFYDLYKQGDSKVTDGTIAEQYSKSREVINRWKHSAEFQELCLVYSRAKYIGLLPKALKTVEDMLENGASSKEDKIRYKIAIDIIDNCKILNNVDVAKTGVDKVGQVNIFNLDKTSEDEIKDKIKNVTNNIKVLDG